MKDADAARIVAHLDMDAFYAEVERVRLNLPVGVPIAVQQWSGLIAVSHSARAFGVKRMDTVENALAKCPDLVFAPVEIKHNKVTLERYRSASERVFSLVQNMCDAKGIVLEVCSIDEAYLDCTQWVAGVMENEKWRDQFEELGAAHFWPERDWREISKKVRAFQIQSSHSIESIDSCQESQGSEALNVNFHLECRHAIGMIMVRDFVNEMRSRIRSELGYSSSVGIAPNALISKLLSARYKPDRHSMVWPSSIAMQHFVGEIPFTDLSSMGGKLGKHVVQCVASALSSRSDQNQKNQKWLCKDLQCLSYEKLLELLENDDELTGRVYRLCRGVCDRVIAPKGPRQTFSETRSGKMTHHCQVMDRLNDYACLLVERVNQACKSSRRVPMVCVLSFRSAQDGYVSHTKRKRIPWTLVESMTVEKLLKEAQELIKGMVLPVRGLGLALTDFAPFKGASEKSLAKYVIGDRDLNLSVKKRKREGVDMGDLKSQTVVCEACGKEVGMEEMPEHKDFHVAFSLHNELVAKDREVLEKKRAKERNHKKGNLLRFFTTSPQ